MPKDKMVYFRAEPRLAKAIKQAAEQYELSGSDFIRAILRKSLGLEVTPRAESALQPSDIEKDLWALNAIVNHDYATNPGGCAEIERNNDNLPYAK